MQPEEGRHFRAARFSKAAWWGEAPADGTSSFFMAYKCRFLFAK
jgi:hypothetical protein